MMSFTFINQALYSQSTCPNADFANTNFDNWQGFFGTYNNPGQNTGFIGGRHTIFAGPGVDPLTCGGLSVLPPGGTASARLGNQGTGGLAEQLRYGLVVDPQNALFVYKYAVVLENPDDHDPNEQPEFSVRLLDAGGNPIGGPCGTYVVYAGQPGQNFNNCGGVTWLPWTTVGIDLTAYMGQQVFIEFTTKDCSLGAHFGYAYISAGCSPLELQLAYCAGDQIISMEAPTGFQTYTWNPGNLTGQTINVPTPADGTVYTCTMSTFSNQGNCAVDVTVTVEPTIVTASFPPGSACINNNLLFLDSSYVNVGTITNWNWDFGDGSVSTAQFPSHPYTDGGTFTTQLIATSDQGCSDTITQDITVYELPVVAFTQTSVCSSDTTHFVNTSTDQFPLSFEWDFGDNTTDTLTSPDHLYANPNNYSVTLTATSSFGCVNNLTQLTDVFAEPVVDAGPDTTLCLFSTLTLNATGAASYSWSNGLSNGSLFNPDPGYYTVTGTDANGCSNTDSLQVSFFAPPVVDAGADVVICLHEMVTLNATGTQILNWDSGVLNAIPFEPPMGDWTFEVVGWDANGCSDTDQVAVTVHSLPVVDAGPDQIICLDAPVILNGSGADSYSWTNGVLNNTPFTPTVASFYTVTGTDQFGCIDSDSVYVAFEQAPVLTGSFSLTSGCAPLEVDFTNTSGTANTCLWNISDGNSVAGCSTTYTFENDGCYDVTLVSTSPLGCVYDTTFSSAVCVYPVPNAAFQPSPDYLLETSPVTHMENYTTGADSYSWNFGDGTGSPQFDPWHTYPEEIGTYDIILTATSDHGCVDTAHATVYVEEDLIYYVPNTFTPDGDGNNDEFKPVVESGMDPHYYHFWIYNRWGETVFESEDIEEGWNGSFRGLVAQDGTYTWKIEFKSTIHRRVDNVVTGHVNILK
jgi:gliding motility-associated-like protein